MEIKLTILLEPVLGLLDGVKDGLLVLLIDLATKAILIVDLVLQGESVVLKTVARLNALTGGLVLLSVLLGLSDHAVNLLLGKTALIVGDGDGLGLASALVVGRDLEDTVGIKLEGDLNLGNATGGGRNAGKLELAKEVVILGHGTLTLVDLDKDDGLVVGGGGEDLALASRDRGVAGDELGHDTTRGLDTEGKGVDIHENDVFSTLLVAKNTSLDGSAESDSLVRVDTLGSLLAIEVLLNKSLDLGDTGGTTDKDDIVNLGLGNLGILENLLDRLEGLLEKVVVELLELGASQSLGEIFAVEEGLDLNTSRHLARKGTLGLLGLTLELAHGLGVLGNIDTVLLVEGLGEVVDDALVEILTTETGVTSGSQDLENALLDGKKGHIESTTTQVVDDDLTLLTGLIKTVGDSGGGGLVDNAEDVETGDHAGILGGLALVVVEVSGNGNNGVGDLLAEVGLSSLLHLLRELVSNSCRLFVVGGVGGGDDATYLAENHGGDLLGGEDLLAPINLDLDNRLVILGDDPGN